MFISEWNETEVFVLKSRIENIRIGFVTGRKSFRQVVRTYAENWHQSGLTYDEKHNLNIIVAYDLTYENTKAEDYKNLDKRVVDLLDYPYFLGESAIKSEIAALISSGVLNAYETDLLFGEGYAKKRNVIMYMALKNQMSYLLFVDDDEYPMAVMKHNEGLSWRGQKVLATHLEHIKNADITYGYHCGYISPIPYVTFNEVLTETDFRIFIESISNDIISWESIKEKMLEGGVTYADQGVLNRQDPEEVTEINGAKFISGSNLCINLQNENKLFPFYNPPGARGEDTFLSTCLTDNKVLRVPSYTFHDGFSAYQHLLCGALPDYLKKINAGRKEVNDRFFRACVGWIRYKPLLLYITKPNEYEKEIDRMKKNLKLVLPKICSYFRNSEFMRLEEELKHYSYHVREHYNMFEDTKLAWKKAVDYLKLKNDCYMTKVN
jgi:hypothetical protein